MFGQECPLLCCGTGCCFFAVNAARGGAFSFAVGAAGCFVAVP